MDEYEQGRRDGIEAAAQLAEQYFRAGDAAVFPRMPEAIRRLADPRPNPLQRQSP